MSEPDNTLMEIDDKKAVFVNDSYAGQGGQVETSSNVADSSSKSVHPIPDEKVDVEGVVTTQPEKLEAHLETPPTDGNNESGEPTSSVDATTPAPGSSATQSVEIKIDASITSTVGSRPANESGVVGLIEVRKTEAPIERDASFEIKLEKQQRQSPLDPVKQEDNAEKKAQPTLPLSYDADNSAAVDKSSSSDMKMDVDAPAPDSTRIAKAEVLFNAGESEPKPSVIPAPPTAEANPEHPLREAPSATSVAVSLSQTSIASVASSISRESIPSTISLRDSDSQEEESLFQANPGTSGDSLRKKNDDDERSGVLADKDSLRAVLAFLRKNNLKEAEETLLKEAKLESNGNALSRLEAEKEPAASSSMQVPKEKKTSPTILTPKEEADAKRRDAELTAAAAAAAAAALAHYQSDAESNIYERQYGALSRFVESSLDSYRFEMALVTYPLFVHMYLEMVFNAHDEDAKKFFQRFSHGHLELYPEDVKTLGTLTTKNHMVKCTLMEHFKTGKFVIRMSRDTYQGLRRHLQDQQLTKILEIVQEHLYIDVYDGAPRNEAQVKSVAGAMEGEAIRERNRVRVFHGLLREPELAIPLEEDDDDEDKEPETKKKKKSKKDSMLVKKSKNDPNAPMTTRIPLPEAKEVDKIDRIISLRESAKRVKVDDSHPVSICFYTLLNAHRGCTAIDVSDDSSLLATGFADSYIRVWSLTPRKLKTVKSASELGQLDVESEDILERMLDDRTAADSKMLLGHSGPIYSVAFSSDRQFLVSASEDATIRLWSLVTFTNLIAYKGHNFAVWCVRFAPCGHYFVSGGQDRTARLWSTDHHQPLRIFAGHLSDVDVVSFHPNCNYVATGSTDRTVRLWDVSNGRCVRNLTGHKGPLQTVSFSPSGRYLASAGADGVVYLWNIATGHLQGWFRHDKRDGGPSSSLDNFLKRSDKNSDPATPLYSKTIYTLAFSRDGSALASGGLDEAVCVWNIEKLMADYDDEESTGAAGNGGNDSNQPMFDENADYCLGRFSTKKTPVLGLHFTRRNLLLAFGPHVS